VSAKLGSAVIVRSTEAVLLRLLEVPVIVTVNVPNVAELAALSLSLLVLVVLAGVKDAVTPVGRSVAARTTVPVNPFSEVIEIVLVPLSR